MARRRAVNAGPVRSNAQLDRIFTAQYKPDAPGVSVAVSQNGRVVYERAFGMASLELGVPVTSASVFQAASISKQFTAASIMLLAQQGKLSIDDPIQKYLPEFPDCGTPLTIRHFLSHTGGLRDPFLLLELFAPDEGRGDQNDRLLSMLARQRGLNFTPGAESVYDNGGYAMLGHRPPRERAIARRLRRRQHLQAAWYDEHAFLRRSGCDRSESRLQLLSRQRDLAARGTPESAARRRYPDGGLGIAIMSNTDDGTYASELTRRVTEVVLADRLTPVPAGEKGGPGRHRSCRSCRAATTVIESNTS